MPLSLVSRIEEIDCRNIENADGRYIVQYRDALMPLLGFEAQVRIKKEGAQPFSCSQNTAARLGFLSTRFDIAEERLDVKMADIDLAYSAMRSLEATSPKSSTSGFFWQPEARSAARHERQGEIDK